MRRIGLAMSGGGYRATVFHLGVLARLAEAGMLDEVTRVSTVSGGSLCAALLFAGNQGRWPDAQQFRERALPNAFRLITGLDFESMLKERTLRKFLHAPSSLLGSRATDLAELIETHWKVTGPMSELPRWPRWIINTTCFETAANWRFTPSYMGDYQFGSTDRVDVPVAQAVAASCAFPGLVGALALDTRGRDWYRLEALDEDQDMEDEHAADEPGAAGEPGDPPSARSGPPGFRKVPKTPDPESHTVHLWDGGVYDNLGVESLLKPGGKLAKGVNYLIVSDGSGTPATVKYPSPWRMLSRAHRLVDIATAQVRGLRSRVVVAHLADAGPAVDVGRYMRIGGTTPSILKQADRQDLTIDEALQTLSTNEAAGAENMATTLRQLSRDEFELLYRNGYEVAAATLVAYDRVGSFALTPYPGLPV